MQFAVNRINLVIMVLSAAASAGPVMAQTPKAQLYAYHTNAVTGGCPGLDWHITVEPDSKLVGFVAWDRGLHMARLDGAISKDRSFEMTAAEVGGAGRKASIKGTAGGEYINVGIYGSGSACDGINLPIPRAIGGVGGDGG